MNIIDSLQWRYATKKFDDARQIPQDKLDIITQAFNLTATSYGLQPVRLLVVQDKKLQEELVAQAMGQRQVVDASCVLVFCIEKNVKSPYVHEYFDNVKSTRDTPEKTLAPFREMLADKFDSQTKEETRNWAINQAYLAMGNLMTVCALEGIDACPMEGFEPDGFDKMLELDVLNISSILIMPIGYRAEDDMFSKFEKVRRSVEDTVIYR
ncbi:NAD(P)H-dependent oxidoreductase [Flavimarina sp. Hel_I_48]|uniref:NAD(P)H-dependent oxidoreductase n=1 Tax=Flavimarina sp. Hel_I_48 TaxID=1392488 RepID=UPI0004DF2F78|nr:NAD(P)H-dependent oxidoreductase [Flavimarina sp. Hel_I_48]